jgi:hypothetical protein
VKSNLSQDFWSNFLGEDNLENGDITQLPEVVNVPNTAIKS